MSLEKVKEAIEFEIEEIEALFQLYKQELFELNFFTCQAKFPYD